MTINVWSYLKEFENEREETMSAVEQVFRSGKLILGENVKNFELSMAAYCGVKHGVGVNSGTDALFLAMKALGIGDGDEVITVSNTAIPTVSAIVSTGAIPKFVDINPETYLMDVNQVEKAITAKTKCIIAVHLYGQCVDMAALKQITVKREIALIEDCAQSTGARQNGMVAGSMSDLACLSFYPTKILGAYGDGGMVITNSETHMAKLRRLRMYGTEKTYYSEEHGFNSRLDEIQAAILLKKLTHLGEYISRRVELARRYEKKLKGTSLLLPKIQKGNQHAYYLYVVRHPERDRIIAELAAKNINVNISYPHPIHLMRGYQSLGHKIGDLPHTELAAKEIFSIPMYPTLTDKEQDYVCEVLVSSV
ncbi:MAG TPA: DegT/DnrJ/EryC1/StrS family aminotransferase [Bacteriovoracaceae bacterium]|nr:DegT/DnrJ/EryC1/StrS family aminotransferase [Bacteriovoracaceae bacterium]